MNTRSVTPLIIDPDVVSLIHKIRLISSKSVRFENSILEAFELTQGQFEILTKLKEKPEGINPSDLKLIISNQNSDLTRLCDKLESKGFITRQRESGNRRKINIDITSAGIQAISKIEELSLKKFSEYIKIDKEECENLINKLDLIKFD
jgi:DNA-binding MarR family transcriptional regulator